MLDAFACRYKGTGSTQDETTGREVPDWPTRFPTPGRVASRAGTPGTRVVSVAGVEVAQAALEFSMPVSGDAPLAGDVIECTSAADDPLLLGRCYRVVGPSAASQRTARRLDVVEVDPPWA